MRTACCKLVRDRIPGVIEQDGWRAVTRVLDNEASGLCYWPSWSKRRRFLRGVRRPAGPGKARTSQRLSGIVLLCVQAVARRPRQR
jgi:hypothetical protein